MIDRLFGAIIGLIAGLIFGFFLATFVSLIGFAIVGTSLNSVPPDWWEFAYPLSIMTTALVGGILGFIFVEEVI